MFFLRKVFCEICENALIVSRTRGGACSVWQWRHRWRRLPQSLFNPTESGQSLHHIVQLRQWVNTSVTHTLFTPSRSLPFLQISSSPQRWRGSRLQGHGYRDHQQWGGAGVPSAELIWLSRDAGGRWRKPRPRRESDGWPCHAPIVSWIFYPGESGGSAQYRPRGLPELSVVGNGGWMVCGITGPVYSSDFNKLSLFVCWCTAFT